MTASGAKRSFIVWFYNAKAEGLPSDVSWAFGPSNSGALRQLLRCRVLCIATACNSFRGVQLTTRLRHARARSGVLKSSKLRAGISTVPVEGLPKSGRTFEVLDGHSPSQTTPALFGADGNLYALQRREIFGASPVSVQVPARRQAAPA
jgi:hypothetical protein